MVNLTVKQLLYLLPGILAVIFTFIGFFTVYSFNQIGKIDHAMLTAMEVNTHTLKLRKHEKDFMEREAGNLEFYQSGQSKYIDKFNRELAEAISHNNSFKFEDLHKTAGIEKEINEIKKQYDLYAQAFFQLTEESKNPHPEDVALK